MKKIDKVKIQHFKAFQAEEEFNFRSKHVLAYGNNGSGKSSLFWALYTFLQSSIKTNDDEVKKYFSDFVESNRATHQTLKNIYATTDKDNVDLKKEAWTLPLDRISSITHVQVDYKKSEIDWDEYFYDIIGVTIPQNGTIAEVQLIVNAEQADYIQTKPLHPSQKIRRLDNGQLHIKLNIIPNFEFEALLLSFGEKVFVQAPAELKTRIENRLRSSLDNYI